MKVSLPHGTILDNEEKTITVDLGNVQLKFSFEEWEEFISIISDIDTVFQSNVISESYVCPSCGANSAFYDYKQPNEDEYN